MDPCFVHSNELAQKFFGLHLNHAKHSFEIATSLRVLSIGSKCGTHLADSFFIPKCSPKIDITESCDMPVASTTSRTFNLLSANTTSWIFSIVSGAVTFFGRLERSASFVHVRPVRNSVSHFFTVQMDGAESPQYLLSSPLVSVMFCFLKKNS